MSKPQSRLGLSDPDKLTPNQKELYDGMIAYMQKKYPKDFLDLAMDKDGHLLGPFGIQEHTPEVGQHFVGFAKALIHIEGLPHQAREIAILVVGYRTKAAYELAAHEGLSGLSPSDLDKIDHGICPDVDEAGEIAYKVAQELCNVGPLPEETWQKAVHVLGIEGATALVHYVGFYKYIATILNGFDVQNPRATSK